MTTRRMNHSILRVVAAGSLAALVAACSSAAGAPAPGVSTSAVTAAPSPALVAPKPTLVATSSPPASVAVIGDGEAWIAFQPFDPGALLAIRPDGTGRHVLFPSVTAGAQLHPDWSPDGEQIVFGVQGADSETLWVGDADGTNTKQIVDCTAPCQWVNEPAWSRHGRSIAFQRMVSQDGVGVSTLEIFDVMRHRTRIAFTAAPTRAIFAPRWNHDGTQLVFEYVEKASPAVDADVTGNALAIIDLTDENPTAREITYVDDRCNNPDWSWVNDTIICSKPVSTTGYDGPADIVSVRPGSFTRFVRMTAVAADGKQAVMPTWLPDGSGIVFADWGGAMSTIQAHGTSLAPAVAGDPVMGLFPRFRPTPRSPGSEPGTLG